jgi:uncharacterized membrane protein YkvI
MPGAGGSQSTSIWDFLRAVLVLGALVLLTLLVIKHYGQDAQKAATILGIAAPILAAVVGGTLGYYAGSSTGQAAGAQKVKQQLDAPIKALDAHLSEGAAGGAPPPAKASQAIGELKGMTSL